MSGGEHRDANGSLRGQRAPSGEKDPKNFIFLFKEEKLNRAPAVGGGPPKRREKKKVEGNKSANIFSMGKKRKVFFLGGRESKGG